MFSDIGPLEVVTLVVLAVILVGPDRLPKMVSDTVRTLRKLRELSQSAQASIREELPPEFKELAFENLSPKAFMTGSLLAGQGLDPGDLLADPDSPSGPSAGAAPSKHLRNPAVTSDHRPHADGQGHPRSRHAVSDDGS